MATEGNSQQNNHSVLVIDDEEVVRILFQSLLEEEGYIPLLAEDGKQGVQLLDQHGPAVALVDKNLPDISGLELIATQRKRHPNTEFIMITGYASLDSAVKAMELGAFSYLTKPFDDMDVVLDRIRAAVEVNNLRVETSLLRERLDKISDHAPHPSGSSSEVNKVAPKTFDQILHTISFLESFLDKRNTPPAPAAWARMVDMIEEEVRRLRQIITTKKK